MRRARSRSSRQAARNTSKIGSLSMNSRGSQCRFRQIVTERRHDGPQPLAPAEVAVDEQARADVRGGVDESAEVGMPRYRSGRVMVEIAAAHAARQQPGEVFRVAGKRDVEYRQLVARLGVHSRKELNVALDAGDEDTGARLLEPQLLQRAKAVGVAIEDVIEL